MVAYSPESIAYAPVARAWTDYIGVSLAMQFPAPAAAHVDASLSPPPLAAFVRRVVRRTGAPLPVVLVAHAYVAKLGCALAKARAASGSSVTVACAHDTPHRAFLAALLLATKVAGDDPARLPASGGSDASAASACSGMSSASLAAAACAATLAAAASAPARGNGNTNAASPGLPSDPCAPLSKLRYTPRDVLAAERSLCKALNYRLVVPSAQLAELVERAAGEVPTLWHCGGAAFVEAVERASQGAEGFVADGF